MRTKEQIDSKLDRMIEQMNSSSRLSASEKANTQDLLNELKADLGFQVEKNLRDIEILKDAELYACIEMKPETIIRFRPRNSIAK